MIAYEPSWNHICLCSMLHHEEIDVQVLHHDTMCCREHKVSQCTEPDQYALGVCAWFDITETVI